MSNYCKCSGVKVVKSIPCVKCSVKNSRPPVFLFSLIFLFLVLGLTNSEKEDESNKVIIKDVSSESATSSNGTITGVVTVFEIHNGSNFEVSNLLVNCVHYSRDGVELKSSQFVIDEKVKPKGNKFVSKFNIEHGIMDFYKSKCHVVKYK